MRIVNSILVVLSCVTFVSACGNLMEDPSENFKSGVCGAEVVGNYKTVAFRCKYIQSEDDELNCKSTAQSFLNKYPRINCKLDKTLERKSEEFFNNQDFSLTDATIRKLVDDVTESGI